MNPTKTLLVELFTEELPPKALKRLGEAFAQSLSAGLASRGLIGANVSVDAYATPRRLAARISHVHAVAADKPVEHKLMPVSVGLDAQGAATTALKKKLAALGAGEVDAAALERRDDGKAQVLVWRTTQRGATLAQGLQAALDDTLAALPIPKVMTYQGADGWTSVAFVRPAHRLVALHGGEVVPVRALGLDAGRETFGHRFEAQVEPVVVQDAEHYAQQLLAQGSVIAAFNERRNEVQRQLQHAAGQLGLEAIDDDALLDEVTALVEKPRVLTCTFDDAFLSVPAECLVLTMKANQKYFPLMLDGQLTNRFLVVSNIDPADPSRIVQGNERVVRPRLADAKFFFDKDRKTRLEDRLPMLDKVVYHAKLGSMGERVARIAAIARAIGAMLGGEPLAAQAERAARLAKADLVTDMVGEFPELQGVMGRYYARHDGEADAVADAIEDHYKPRFAGDSLPRGDVGICAALADKLETLVGLFGVGERPTGEKDPFALRRHALGVLRILFEKDLSLGLGEVLKVAQAAFTAGTLLDRVSDLEPWMAVMFFVSDRATSYLQDQSYEKNEIAAVVNMVDVPKQWLLRMDALRDVQGKDIGRFQILANADKRARNIINKSSGSQGTGILTADESLMSEPAERDLLAIVRSLRGQVNADVSAGEFRSALSRTLAVSSPLARFFDEVMVNAEDEAVRANRFSLLHEVTGLTNRVADLSKLAT